MLPEDYWMLENGDVVTSEQIIIEDLEDLMRGFELCSLTAEDLLNCFTDDREKARLKAELLPLVEKYN